MASRDLNIILKLQDQLSGQLRAMNTEVTNFGNSFKTVGDNMSKLGGNINKLALPPFIALIGGMTLVSKNAFDQVRAVENARETMLAYGGSIEETDTAMKEAVAFVRSDKGKLFQRQDILEAQAGLFGMGVALDEVTDGAITVAKATIPVGRSFDELLDIVRNVEAEGRLSVIRFNQLARAGVNLDDSLVGTSMSAEDLLQHMEAVLPDDLISGRANTIDGMLITLQSSFRDLGLSILGVDEDTSELIEGGLGDTLMQIVGKLPEMLSRNKEAFKQIGETIVKVIDFILPLMEQAINIFAKYGDKIFIVLGLAVALGTGLIILGSIFASIGAIITTTAIIIGALSLPIIIIIGIIGALVAVGLFLYANWTEIIDGLLIMWDDFKESIYNVWESIKETFGSATDWIIEKTIKPLVQWIQKIIDMLKRTRDGVASIGGKIGGKIGGAISSGASAIRGVLPFADGGIVTRPTLGFVGEAGPEAIIPLNKSNGMGATINLTITGNTFMGEDDVAEKVGDKMIHILRQNLRLSNG